MPGDTRTSAALVVVTADMVNLYDAWYYNAGEYVNVTSKNERKKDAPQRI